MGTMEINAKVQELKELETLQKEIEIEMETIKDQLKTEMSRRNTEELNAGVFKVRYKSVTSKRFDSKAFKTSHEDLYNAFVKESKSMRFTVS